MTDSVSQHPHRRAGLRSRGQKESAPTVWLSRFRPFFRRSVHGVTVPGIDGARIVDARHTPGDR